MKKLVLLSAIAMSGLFNHTADAQFRIHLGIHLFPNRFIEAPGPVIVQAPAYQDQDLNNFSDYNDFYYLPDVGAYYNVVTQLYYYQDGDQWIATAYLPGVYRDFDWRYARRIEIHEARPFLHNDFYRNKYQGFDCDLVRNHDHFREGFDFNRNRDAYNAPRQFNNANFNQRLDHNSGGHNEQFDNRAIQDQHFNNQNGQDQRFVNRDGQGQYFNNHSEQGQRFDNKGETGQKLNNQGDGGRSSNMSQVRFNSNDNADQYRGDQKIDQNRYPGKNDNIKADRSDDQDKNGNKKQDRLVQNDKNYDGQKNGRNRF